MNLGIMSMKQSACQCPDPVESLSNLGRCEAMFSLLVSRHFAKRCEMDPSLPTYVLPILSSSSSSIDLRPYTEGRPEWTLGRARVTTPCAASDRTERREIEKSFLASNPMSCNIDGVHGRLGELSSSWPGVMR